MCFLLFLSDLSGVGSLVRDLVFFHRYAYCSNEFPSFLSDTKLAMPGVAIATLWRNIDTIPQFLLQAFRGA